MAVIANEEFDIRVAGMQGSLGAGTYFAGTGVKGHLLAITRDVLPIASCMDTVARAQPGIGRLEQMTCVTGVIGLTIVSCG